MGLNRIPDDEMRRTRDILEKHKRKDGTYNVTAAAREAGLAKSTMHSRIQAMERPEKMERVEFPEFHTEEDTDEPVEELLDRLTKSYERRRKAASAREWFSIRINEDRPYGVLIVGDPHLGDPGCNLPLLFLFPGKTRRERLDALIAYVQQMRD